MPAATSPTCSRSRTRSRRRARTTTRVDGEQLVLGYERETFRRATAISATTPAQIDEDGLDVRRSRIEPHGAVDDRARRRRPCSGSADERTRRARRAERAPARTCERDLDAVARRRAAARVRLGPAQARPTGAASSTSPRCGSRRRSPAGAACPPPGLPWFMTMFGRDSIFTSLQALPFAPELAATTLRALGELAGHARRRLPRRGPRPDPARDALRRDDRVRGAAALAVLRLRRRHAAVRRAARRVRALDRRHASSCASSSTRRARRSTGSTSTPTSRATATSRTSAATRRPASRTSAGRTPGTRSPTATAGCPGFPRATCELQGYAYDAKMRGARLAREVWKDPAFADELEKQAADLKRRFNRDFWVEDGEYFALALDADGNAGRRARRRTTATCCGAASSTSRRRRRSPRHLMGPRLFSGWGVRTLAEGEGRYNPIGYHVGTVWPFDNSFIAWGLRRYGFKDEAARIAAGILDAAEFFDGRLPEAFGGYERVADEVPGPVPDRVQPAGVVDRRAAAAAAHDARARADRRPPRRRPGAPGRHRPPRAARHPRPLGPHRRLRPRAGRRRPAVANDGEGEEDTLTAVR